MEGEEYISGADSGASLTEPTQVGSLRKNGHCMLKGHPCKIVEINTAKVGKHGSAKAKITGLDIFTNNKYEEIHPTGHNIDIPLIDRFELTLMDIANDGYLSLVDDEGNDREDLKLPADEVGEQIQKSFNGGATVVVTILKAMGLEKVVASKEI